MYRKIMLFTGIIGVSLSLALGLLEVITWQIVPVLITVSLGIPSLILTYEKLTSEVKVEPKKKEHEQEIKAEEKEILKEETIRVSPNDQFYYEFELTRGDILKGKISSNCHIYLFC